MRSFLDFFAIICSTVFIEEILRFAQNDGYYCVNDGYYCVKY